MKLGCTVKYKNRKTINVQTDKLLNAQVEFDACNTFLKDWGS